MRFRCRYERLDHQYQDLPEYDGHAIHALVGDSGSRLIAATCIHREGGGTPTNNGVPATAGGGIRWRPHCGSQTDVMAITDGLRLSKGMSEKAAVLGEAVGGAKTVIFGHNIGDVIVRPDGFHMWSDDIREEVWHAFTRVVLPNIPGYIMAEDSGTSARDMARIKKYAPCALVAGLTHDTDPSPITADGVVLGINVVLQSLGWCHTNAAIRHCSYAVMGVGAVGGAIVERLIKNGAQDIRIADPNPERLREVSKGRKEVRLVPLNSIHEEFVDIFIPCALGGSLNSVTVPLLACRAVAGCENNQLGSVQDGIRLHELGIQYAPDFVINGGGLIKVFSELIEGRTVERMLPRIGENLRRIFDRSKVQNRASSLIAKEWATELIDQTMFLPK